MCNSPGRTLAWDARQLLFVVREPFLQQEQLGSVYFRKHFSPTTPENGILYARQWSNFQRWDRSGFSAFQSRSSGRDWRSEGASEIGSAKLIVLFSFTEEAKKCRISNDERRMSKVETNLLLTSTFEIGHSLFDINPPSFYQKTSNPPPKGTRKKEISYLWTWKVYHSLFGRFRISKMPLKLFPFLRP